MPYFLNPAHFQVWRYDEGDITHIGVGHSGEITGVRISPDGQHIVSVSNDGAIMRWKYPCSPQTTPLVPHLDLASKSTTPRQGGGADTGMEITPKRQVEMKVTSPSLQEMEVGGASPKQEE